MSSSKEKATSQKPNVVFAAAAALVLVAAVFGLVAPGTFAAVANAAFSGITNGFGWLYPLAMTLFVVFSIWVGFFSKYKNMRLGPDDSRPEHSTGAWFAMLFSAGMGVGLVFWGVAEPLGFFVNPLGAEPGTGDAMRFAFSKDFLHWGLHPWACYVVIALGLAYMQFRKKQPTLISSLFTPLIGEKGSRGPLGKVVDVCALLASAGGVCTTLGMGVLLINSGLTYLFGVPQSMALMIGIIVVFSVVYVTLAVAGVEKGMGKISNANIIIAVAVAVVLFLVGPTVDILNNLVEGIGAYISSFVADSFKMGAFGDHDWYANWTIYYWAWWIAWSPFTGAFIARISRGRTVKEFVGGVLFVPAIVCMVWFAIFGTLGMNLGLDTAAAALADTATSLFYVIAQYPLGRIIAMVMLVLTCTFCLASATGACTSLGMYSENGTLNPSNRTKVVWGVLLAVLLAALLLSSDDGLGMLKTLSIVVGFPFAIISIVAMVALIKAFKGEDTVAIEAAYKASLTEGDSPEKDSPEKDVPASADASAVAQSANGTAEER
jgi:glycine betaine transporter